MQKNNQGKPWLQLCKGGTAMSIFKYHAYILIICNINFPKVKKMDGQSRPLF